MSESYLKQKCNRIAKRYRFTPVRPDEEGWPDKPYAGPNGVTLWVEFKNPATGRLEPRQISKIRKLRKLGHLVVVAWNEEQFESALQRASDYVTIRSSEVTRTCGD